jgi:hypothetical protein
LVKIKKINRQPLPKAVETYMRRQTAILDAETEMRSPEYHNNCGAIYERRQQVQTAYEYAAQISAEDLLNASAGVRYQYDVIMSIWEKVSSVLDSPDLYHDEATQNRALSAVTALLATLPC